MALYFVVVKHQRRQPICLHHGLSGWKDFADFFANGLNLGGFEIRVQSNLLGFFVLAEGGGLCVFGEITNEGGRPICLHHGLSGWMDFVDFCTIIKPRRCRHGAMSHF